MTCNPCTDRPCPHCDQECKIVGCTTCRADALSWAQTAAAISRRPQPTHTQIHDLDQAGETQVKVPDGQIGRCPGCGGRTYTLDGIPWCPRPFCWTGRP